MPDNLTASKGDRQTDCGRKVEGWGKGGKRGGGGEQVVKGWMRESRYLQTEEFSRVYVAGHVPDADALG